MICSPSSADTLLAMLLFLISRPFLLGALCISLSLIFILSKNKKSNLQNLPPGNKGWPIIGETLDFVSSGRKGNPEKFIDERKKKYSSEAFRTSLAGENMVVMCGPSGNKLLFSNENKLVVSWWPPTNEKILISGEATSIGETKKMRGYLPEFLKPEALQRYVQVMDRMAKEHFEKEWKPNTQVTAFPLSKKYTFALACRLFMSVEEPGQVGRLAEHYTRVMAGLMSVPINFPGTSFHRGIRAAKRIREELLPVIRKRRDELLSSEKKHGANRDLLSHMLLATDEDGKFMTEMEIIDKILGLLLASHDTTSTVITFTVFYLADHPHVYDQVLKEHMAIEKGPEEVLNWEDMQKMKYSRNVINEAMRLAPPSQGAFKDAISDIAYAGFSIPKGWKVHWSVYSTHKDPQYFPSPNTFDPSRFEGSGPQPFTFVPFGGGPRMCPGSEFARLEILVFIHNLVKRYKWKKVIPDEKVIFDPTPIPVNGLPIQLLPCQPQLHLH